jgi:hypothetical protein
MKPPVTKLMEEINDVWDIMAIWSLVVANMRADATAERVANVPAIPTTRYVCRRP